MSPTMPHPTKADDGLGKALADRLGLRHNETLREWSAESLGRDAVWVTMSVAQRISLEEFNELRYVAAKRAKETP